MRKNTKNNRLRPKHPITFSVVTLFPEIVRAYLGESILGRAAARRLIRVQAVNPRDFARNKHRKVDDRPYGGGPGMVLSAEPLLRAFASLTRSIRSAHAKKRTAVVWLAPAGRQFSLRLATEWPRVFENLIFIAGHYEGTDERVKTAIRDLGFRMLEISAGPYVLTGGELPALMMIDAVARHVPGVLGKAQSLEEGREGVGVPAYTRPEAFRFGKKNYKVPGALLRGNHAEIEAWRRAHAKDSLT